MGKRLVNPRYKYNCPVILMTTLLARRPVAASIKAVVLRISSPGTGDQIEAFSALFNNIATITTNRLNVSSRASVVESNCSTTTVLGTSYYTNRKLDMGSDAQASTFSTQVGVVVYVDLSSFTADSKTNGIH